MTRVGLDSNILAYLAGVSRVAEDDAKIDRVREIIGRLSKTASLVAPTQALGELFVVLRQARHERGQDRFIPFERSHSRLLRRALARDR